MHKTDSCKRKRRNINCDANGESLCNDVYVYWKICLLPVWVNWPKIESL